MNDSVISPLEDTIPPYGYLVFQAFFLSIIMILIIFGNIAVCYVVYRTKSIATVTGMSILSLAIADILRGSVVLPFVIITSLFGADWTFGIGLCTVTGIFHTMMGSASVMTLGAVSLDRYIAILKPLKYVTIVTTIRAAALLVIIWTTSSLTALLPLLGWSRYIFIPWTCICVVDWRREYSVGYAYFYLAVAFILPFAVLAYCYYRIFVVAKSQSRRVMALEMASLDGNTLQRSTAGGLSRGQKFASVRKEKKSALTLFIIMGIFISCVTPYCVVYLIASYRPTNPVLAMMGVTSILSFLNSAANPMIYGILNRKFRRVFLKIITCKRCKNRLSNQVIPSNNGTASTVMMRKRQARKDNERGHGNIFSTKGVFKLSVAAATGGTMACVMGKEIAGMDHLTVKHLPTIEDVSEVSDRKRGRLPISHGISKPDIVTVKDKSETLTIDASVDKV